MMYGADISISHLLFQALSPATLGNIVGGGIFIGAVYWYLLDSNSKLKFLFSRNRKLTSQSEEDTGNDSNSDEDEKDE